MSVLAEGAHAPEQIAARLGVADPIVRDTLDSLYRRGHVEASTLLTRPPNKREPPIDPMYWRITDAGRARLEDLRAADT